MDGWRWRLEWGLTSEELEEKRRQEGIWGRTAKIEGYLRGSVET